jgi:hypothetical protein
MAYAHLSICERGPVPVVIEQPLGVGFIEEIFGEFHHKQIIDIDFCLRACFAESRVTVIARRACLSASRLDFEIGDYWFMHGSDYTALQLVVQALLYW